MHLIVMTRLPREGRNKTRLIPVLGVKGAMEFHGRLARHAIGRASGFCMMGKGRRLRICIEGGTPIEGKSWLGDDNLDCREQADGDLGTRMRIAAEEAFAEGAEKVIIIGTDCPGIDENILSQAEDLLDHNALVFGPALDGGYYLVGMAKPAPAIFEGVSWGGEKVLAQSLDAAGRAGLEWSLLDTLPDADLAEDLPAAEKSLREGSTVSVIMPVLNEASCIADALARVSRSFPHQIIVVDGGSTDRTVAIAQGCGACVITSVKGRGHQMNAGAARATGEFLLFLHADTLPPENFPAALGEILKRPDTAAGAFRLMLGGDLGAAPLIEALVDMRCRILGRPYGDQGIFLRRSLFQHIGGYREIPVMEDIDLIRRLAKLGKIRISKQVAVTSARRWESGGLIRTFLTHQLMLAAYRLGTSPSRITGMRDGISPPAP